MRDAARYIVFTCADLYGGAQYIRIDRPDRCLPPANDPGVGDERSRRSPIGQRRADAASGSNASSATSMPNIVMRVDAVASLARDRQGARAGIGRIMSTMTGTPAYRPRVPIRALANHETIFDGVDRPVPRRARVKRGTAYPASTRQAAREPSARPTPRYPTVDAALRGSSGVAGARSSPQSRAGGAAEMYHRRADDRRAGRHPRSRSTLLTKPTTGGKRARTNLAAVTAASASLGADRSSASTATTWSARSKRNVAHHYDLSAIGSTICFSTPTSNIRCAYYHRSRQPARTCAAGQAGAHRGEAR